jgi:hypothetical protein
MRTTMGYGEYRPATTHLLDMINETTPLDECDVQNAIDEYGINTLIGIIDGQITNLTDDQALKFCQVNPQFLGSHWVQLKLEKWRKNGSMKPEIEKSKLRKKWFLSGVDSYSKGQFAEFQATAEATAETRDRGLKNTRQIKKTLDPSKPGVHSNIEIGIVFEYEILAETIADFQKVVKCLSPRKDLLEGTAILVVKLSKAASEFRVKRDGVEEFVAIIPDNILRSARAILPILAQLTAAATIIRDLAFDIHELQALRGDAASIAKAKLSYETEVKELKRLGKSTGFATRATLMIDDPTTLVFDAESDRSLFALFQPAFADCRHIWYKRGPKAVALEHIAKLHGMSPESLKRRFQDIKRDQHI